MKYVRHNTYAFGIFLVTILLYWLLSYFHKDLRTLILSIIHLCCILLIMNPFLKVNGLWIINRFVGYDNSWWDKRIERPRILLYVLYIVLVTIFIYIVNSTNDVTLIGYEIILTALLINGAYALGRAIWKEEFGNQFIPIKEHEFILEFKLRKLNKEEIELITKNNEPNFDKDSIDDFRKFLNHEVVDNKIKWIGTSGKRAVTFTNLFKLIHSLIEGGEKKKLINPQKDIMLYYLIDNFTKYENGVETELIRENLNSAYFNFNIDSLKKIV